MASSLSATSLATVMQMVASGYATLVPEVAVDVELRDDRVKLLRFVEPQPGRSIGLVWRRTSPRKADFQALGQTLKNVLNAPLQRTHPVKAAGKVGYGYRTVRLPRR